MKFLFSLLMICFPLLSDAATPVDSIGTETVKGNSFIRYQVGNGEGWYTIARKYGISYSELRLANKTQDDKLKIGQILLIPAKAKPTDPRFQKNYLDKFSKGTVSQSQPGTSTGSPVIHRVTKSETLYSIAKKYNASVEQVRLWNHLKDNSIRLDQALIVGYGPVSPRTTDPDEKKSTVVKKDSQVKNQYSGKSDSVAPAVTIEPRKVETVIVKTVSPNKPKIEERKQDNKYIFTAGRKEVNEQGVASWIEDEEINPNKYYALHRSAPSGTIIKITNRMNNKSIFVKVVGRLPDTGDNEGLIIKISKASAEKLGVLDQRFSAELIYGISEK